MEGKIEMTITCIYGSSQITNNNDIQNNLIKELDKRMNWNHSINVGDAKGIDYFTQLYLNNRNWKKVCVWYTNSTPRNIVENPYWEKSKVVGGYKKRNHIMLNDSDELIAVWNNKSQETKQNIDSFTKGKVIVICEGINISSDEAGLGGALSINDKAAYRKNKIKRTYSVEWGGVEYDGAIDIWNNDEIKNKYLNYEVTHNIYEPLPLFMRDIMKAKFISNKCLHDEIRSKGGIDFLRRCKHIKSNNNSPKFRNLSVYHYLIISGVNSNMWEGKGYNSLYIDCLIDAYLELL